MKNTAKPTNEKTICLVRILPVLNSINSTDVNKVNQEIILNIIN